MLETEERYDQAETLGRLVVEARSRLAAAKVPDAALESRMLVEHFTGTGRLDAVRNPNLAIDGASVGALRSALARRVAGEPVHRILGHREFYGLPLRLSPDTLEPRPDTEALVDLALPFVRHIAAAEGVCRVLDLGTGTGAIALALLDREPKARALGIDISAGALAMAEANADMLGVGDRFGTLKSNWLDDVEGRFHLIVSNPPYIATRDLDELQAEVRNFDPRRALDGGADGLDAYRTIAGAAARHLEGEARVAVEIGYDQKAAVIAIFEAAEYRLADHASDLAGHDRALMFRL